MSTKYEYYAHCSVQYDKHMYVTNDVVVVSSELVAEPLIGLHASRGHSYKLTQSFF